MGLRVTQELFRVNKPASPPNLNLLEVFFWCIFYYEKFKYSRIV